MPLGGSLDFFPNQFQYISTPRLSANSYDFENVTCFPLSNNQLYPSQLSWLLQDLEFNHFPMQPFIFTRPSFTIATAYFLVLGLGLRIKLMMQNLRIKTKYCVCPGTSQKKHISTLFQYRLKKERERNLRELESERRTRMRKRARSRTTFFLQLLKCFINQPEHIQGKFRILINLFFSIFMFIPP